LEHSCCTFGNREWQSKVWASKIGSLRPKNWNLLRPKKLELASVWPSARRNDCSRETPMRMQSSSESGRVASCLPLGTTSSKTKCVRLRNERSLQHPKQISARAIVEGTRKTILVLCSYTVVILHSQLRCVRTFRTCSRVSTVQFVALLQHRPCVCVCVRVKQSSILAFYAFAGLSGCTVNFASSYHLL